MWHDNVNQSSHLKCQNDVFIIAYDIHIANDRTLKHSKMYVWISTGLCKLQIFYFPSFGHFSVLWKHYTPGPLSLQFPLITIVCLCVQPCNMKQILIGAYSAVLPCESWMLVEALCLRSSWMRRWFPLADALCSGVESNLSVALGSAPFSSSIRAI